MSPHSVAYPHPIPAAPSPPYAINFPLPLMFKTDCFLNWIAAISRPLCSMLFPSRITVIWQFSAIWNATPMSPRSHKLTSCRNIVARTPADTVIPCLELVPVIVYTPSWETWKVSDSLLMSIFSFFIRIKININIVFIDYHILIFNLLLIVSALSDR